MSEQLVTIPARSGKAALVKAGQRIKIINTHGAQIVDTWAFNPCDPSEYLSMQHTRAYLDKVIPSAGDTLVSNRRRPMLQFVEDTSPGVHDTLIAACDIYRYIGLGVTEYHDNCQDNMYAALRELGVSAPTCPSPLNLWMNTPAKDNTIVWLPPFPSLGTMWCWKLPLTVWWPCLPVPRISFQSTVRPASPLKLTSWCSGRRDGSAPPDPRTHRHRHLQSSGGEEKALRHLESLLGDAGFEVTLDLFGEGRGSLVARYNRGATDTSLCFAGHIDTVPLGTAAWSRPPFGAEVHDGLLYGRGASDMKSGIAAMCCAAMAAAAEKVPGRSPFLSVAARKQDVRVPFTWQQTRGCWDVPAPWWSANRAATGLCWGTRAPCGCRGALRAKRLMVQCPNSVTMPCTRLLTLLRACGPWNWVRRLMCISVRRP